MHLMYNFRNNVRKPGWEKAIDDKLQQIIDYMNINNITDLFTAGDIFDKTTDWSFKQFQANIERLRWFKDAGIKIHSNLGNHDMASGREHVDGTVFKAAVDLDLINYIGTGMEPVVFEVGGSEVLLFGIDYHSDTSKVLLELKEVSEYPRGIQSSKICLTHANITTEKEIVTDLSYNQISNYDIDTLCCGHWHLCPKEGAVLELNKTHFLNPWNLSRVTREYHTKLDEHKPEFIHSTITFDEDGPPVYNFEEVFLEVGKFTESFQVDIINMLQEMGKKKSQFGFFDEIELDSEEDLNDDEILLKTIAESQKISEASVNIAKGLLS